MGATTFLHFENKYPKNKASGNNAIDETIARLIPDPDNIIGIK
ncbi:MAG TPA: hypothetical protein VFC84_11675 [Desulfosporosinus sp.]|nr:hypothetical protein [Desulfosporosinus sp.]